MPDITWYVMVTITTPAGTEADEVMHEVAHATEGIGENELDWTITATLAP